MFNGLGKEGARRTGTKGLSDGWGYNYVGNLCHDMVSDTPAYQGFLRSVLQNTAKPAYRNYRWEGNSIDGPADSLEGGLYILNRIPVGVCRDWIDLEMARNVVFSSQPLKTARLWGTIKFQSNAVRTTLIHATMHTRGLLAHPWRQGMRLGAAEEKGSLTVKAGRWPLARPQIARCRPLTKMG